ncbi:MAG TPA: NADH-quinone oxidoreductase subunit C [Anaerolineales bacterium]|nr:NADH-quinone oxidoreductase subunit C [Anaerolineales bacterium]HMV96778.1 NADH-quinone oxidoreductase subunit C [Anaerolineales bacterium]HMX17999.1 NADH-quinone oxidoreductase subunit C [Anaerolineales bacterium]HMX73014.1 NADH-quinone oxidoreductase subunit C [Anaerolineales bacterium]HMZ42750.1 NADH-quinone oxidoreductase subunit C [Anaerolineales bacterium]
MATAIQTSTVDLVARFPGKVTADTRPGYSGFIVNKDNLVEVATAIRDEFGFDLLTAATGADYIAENKMEMVYHAYKTTGGPGLVFKVQVERVDPVEIPSLINIWPGVDFQEREAWDLLGIKFTGHPDLRRILMWEGYEGHPLRKDWKEPFFEEEAKPFKSRWPDGQHTFAENKNPFRDNLKFPADFDPEKFEIVNEDGLYASLERHTMKNEEGSLNTDHIVVNMGPHHPSTHGVLRVAVTLDGETIIGLKPVMGYLHRNHDKIGERNTYLQVIPYTDRLDYFNSMSNNFGYVTTIEKLMKIQVAERAEYIRVIMAELSRVQNHLIFIGMLMNDLGTMYTPSLYAFEERELVLDIFEAVSGARMMCNYFRFGGVVRDIPDYVMQKIKDLVFERLPAKTDEMERFLNENEILVARLKGIHVLNAEDAIKYSVTGPVLRAAGVPYDLRRADPYSIYDRFDFDVAVRQNGDMMDNYLIRFDEIRQSLRILEQALKQIPQGPINSQKPQYQVRVPAGEAYGRIESPKGELGFYVVSNGKPNPYRYHVRPASFVNLQAVESMCIGTKIADFVALLAMLDIVMGELDR